MQEKLHIGFLLDEEWSAIQLTTAAGMCAAVDLHFSGQLPSKGFVKQEDINLKDFISNRFGKFYAVVE